jgi:hypothetical protein
MNDDDPPLLIFLTRHAPEAADPAAIVSLLLLETQSGCPLYQSVKEPRRGQPSGGTISGRSSTVAIHKQTVALRADLSSDGRKRVLQWRATNTFTSKAKN